MSTNKKKKILQLDDFEDIETLKEIELMELESKYKLGLRKIEEVRQKREDEKNWMTKMTLKELSNHLVHGYI